MVTLGKGKTGTLSEEVKMQDGDELAVKWSQHGDLPFSSSSPLLVPPGAGVASSSTGGAEEERNPEL